MNDIEKKKYSKPSIDVIVIQDQNVVTEQSTEVPGEIIPGNETHS